MNLRKILKKNKVIKNLYINVVAKKYSNCYKTNFPKNALLSYSTAPFRQKNKKLIHPNFVENYTLAEILHDAGYNVDVYNNTYNGKIDYKKYDLIIGEGNPISNYFYSGCKKNIKTIYYATGSHPFYNNIQSYGKLIDFYNKYSEFLFDSSRIVDFKWGVGAALSDYNVILGNEITKNTFCQYKMESNVFNLNPPYYTQTCITNFDKKNKQKFLWFGSFGLIHKDLYTCIEFFENHPEFELYICGYLYNESKFLDVMERKRKFTSNIHFLGFVNIASDQFKQLMEECTFTILTSCAEGCATAIETVLGNGGLIPIISKQCGITIPNGITVNENTYEALEAAILNLQKLTYEEIKNSAKNNIEYMAKSFSIENYKSELNRILKELI